MGKSHDNTVNIIVNLRHDRATNRETDFHTRTIHGFCDFPMINQERCCRSSELQIRQDYLKQAMESAIREAQTIQMKLAAKVAAGDKSYRVYRDNAQRNDPEVEAIAMQWVMDYERDRGWEPQHISKDRDGSGFDIRSIGPADPETVLTFVVTKIFLSY